MSTPSPGFSAPSLPTLLAEEARAGITEYLSTTFALADTDARDALEAFLGDPSKGIFRGPYLRVRTPFQQVDSAWASPLGWLPHGFRPFRHQARAFERLSTLGKAAEPTIVTTGTGSGKTESFLVPLLDHARRARERGEGGIKAIILYPMNALVTDQARRLANYLHDEPALAGVSAGVYIGGDGHHSTPTREHLVDKREALRQSPPDILLTNYKMLDLLLLRRDDTPLWAASATSLQFLVLDEFHTYDGAQGTDVAMLIRRLGATCKVAEAGRPLGRITPVATSATLGGGTRSGELLAFAETVFGAPFGPDALVTEERLDASDVVPDVDFGLDIPSVDAILAADTPNASDPSSWIPLARAVLEPAAPGAHAAPHDYSDQVELGSLLRSHFLTRAVVDCLGPEPLTPADAVTQITQAGVLPWGVHNTSNPAQVQQALLRFLALLSIARVADTDGVARPLVNLQVQLWARELTRMLRRVAAEPEFDWWHDAPDSEAGRFLPAAHCRVCGRSGWIAVATELGDSLGHEPTAIWRASARFSQRHKTRVLLLAGADEAGVQFLDPETLELHATPAESTLAVHVTADAKQAARQECPSCGAEDAIRFLGSSVATLLSVALTQLFGSDLLPEAEKKTLVFTDSVQDAAHRAAFVEGRAFQFNFRSALLGAAGTGPVSLDLVAQRLTDTLSDRDLYAITPPDFVRRKGLSGDWLADDPGKRLHKLLATRVGFQVQLELGLNARLGRTLELTGALAIDVDVDLDHAAGLARAIHENLPEHTPLTSALAEAAAYQRWLLGVLEYLRTRGGIHHRWLRQYIADDGRRWSIWGRSADGMPKFPHGRPAPGFFTTATGSDTSFISLNPRGESWLTDWTRRCLGGVPTGEARALLAPVIDVLAADGGPLERRTSSQGAKVYGLRPDSLVVYPAGAQEQPGPVRLQCPECHHVQPSTPARSALWEGAPCPRLRCQGTLAITEPEAVNFYRRLYSSGKIRRIVAHEHTGLLSREDREDVETRFKAGTSPIDPNILTCTPTLELGIDIGDLSTVNLASLPRATANYLQRVGRAGRSTGNAYVFAAVPSSPRDLYYFAEPKHLIDGEVLPPGAYLNATELLQRQFFAFCLDRAADGGLSVAKPMPNLLGATLAHGMDEGAWLRLLIDTITAQCADLAEAFLSLYAGCLAPSAADAVTSYGAGGLQVAAARAVLDWQHRTDEIRSRMNALAQAIATLDAQGHLDDQQKEDRRRCSGESKGLALQLGEMNRHETLTGLAGIGLLPNYNLLDDATTLDVHLWWTSGDDGDRATEAMDLTYERSSRTALTELAPGAYFYAAGKRVEIDAVDIGSVGQPLWSRQRLCPACGWGTNDTGTVVGACPRCHNNAVADAGALHKVLPLRHVSAVHRLDDAVIDEDADERVRTFFTSVTGVDINPADIVRAWRLTGEGKVFGAEYARRALVRTVNVGLGDSPGTEVGIAGETVTASRFITCSHCGVVRKPHVDVDSVRHRGFCATRHGTPQQWEELILSHELSTQAVRLLLPVSTLHFETKLTSFMGALLLGLRRDFGGDPQHLSVVTSSMSDGNGQIRRFLVLHDTVPGGTGYLDRFGEPERLREILVLARDALAACPCQYEARAACHRCLLGVLRPREMEHASRSVALDLINDLLDGWDVDVIDTVGDIDVAPVQLSELELRFREALKAWLDQRSGCSYAPSISPTGEQLDIRLASPDGQPRRWTMRPLVNVAAGSVTTQPDFVLTRADAQGCSVAIYLDGKQYHASPTHNISADDAVKRAALRDHGWRVWSLTWEDVEAFASGSVATAGALVVTEAQNAAHAEVADDRIRAMWANPVDFLLSYLADPDAPVWGDGAAATVTALVGPGKHGDASHLLIPPASLASTLMELAGGQIAATTSGTIMVVPRHGTSGLPLFLVANPDQPDATLGGLALLDDRDSEVGGPDHAARWRDWLCWANLLQFLVLPRHGHELPLRMAEVWTRRSIEQFAQRHLPLAAVPVGPTVDVFTFTAPWQIVVDYTATETRPLLRELSQRGIAVPQPGDEVGTDESVWQVELSWPDEKIVVIVDDIAERDHWLKRDGWHSVRYREDDSATSTAEQIGELLKDGHS